MLINLRACVFKKRREFLFLISFIGILSSKMRYQNFLFNKGVIGTRLNTFVRASFYWILYFLTVYGNMIILFDTNTVA